MHPEISLFILVDGMKRGVFTGMKLDDYISDEGVDFFNARKTVNSTDKAKLIETYAMNWQTQLGWLGWAIAILFSSW